ncbi:hypothetical protein AMS68_000762 [Peltaster fructicola]|uniref:Uncharacterized protein n=1 Tax=Peltaster fructicola TaxID=286661 RepID=A0A6H0XKU7_9PEZI|nr:hypothetical protein AMS68_000762 [Peltaster fructicola]
MTGQNAHNDVNSSVEYKAAHDYVSGHVTSLAKAQDKFCEPAEDKFMTTQNAEDVEGLLWKAWGGVVELAKTTADNTVHRQKLVDFVLGLQQRPKLQKGDEVCKVWDATVWSDLPVFGAQIRECWNAAASDSSVAEEQHQWLNINAFTAALVASAHSNEDKPDFTLFAIWALRQAFEEEKPSKIATEAAAAWLICAAPALSELSKNEKSFDGKLARAGSSYQDKQWTGFNGDRWQIWVSKLSKVDASGFGARGGELIKKARQKVSELE